MIFSTIKYDNYYITRDIMFIGNLKIETPIFLAPMAGVCDMAYRILAHRLGCDLVYSEMVSEKGIHFRNEHTMKMLNTNPLERPIALQLFGSTPNLLAEAAKYIEAHNLADIIDINMGCPAPKIVKNHEGSALLKNPALAFDIMQAVRKAVKLPVTVKMRMGWDDAHINVVEMAHLAEEAGLDAVAVHGRTREQFYSGRANWDIIRQVKETIRIPVIGNGDVRTCEDMQKMFQETSCDAIMIGRAAQGNPWIFREMKYFWQTGKKIPPPTIAERKQLILEHLDMLIEFKGTYIGTREMRKHATWYTRGITGGAELRRLFNAAETREDFLHTLELLES